MKEKDERGWEGGRERGRELGEGERDREGRENDWQRRRGLCVFV